MFEFLVHCLFIFWNSSSLHKFNMFLGFVSPEVGKSFDFYAFPGFANGVKTKFEGKGCAANVSP